MKPSPVRLVLPFLCFVSVSLSACGGGGGGGDAEAFYAGLWKFFGIRVRDTCNIAPRTVEVDLTVNQDGTRVVVDSGSIVLTGSTDPDTDGFSATASRANGCGGQDAFAYVFRDASDGEADTGLAVITRCADRSQCTSSWGGDSIRQNTRAQVDSTALDDAAAAMAEAAPFSGRSAGPESVEDAALAAARGAN